MTTKTSSLASFAQQHRRIITISLYVLGAALLLASLTTWLISRQADPTSVFWGMIDNSLRTTGVTRIVESDQGGQKVTQLQQVQLGGINRARSLTTLEQNGMSVETETISTPETDYVRYNKLNLSSTMAKDGKKADFSKVLGVWAKSTETSQFTRSIFGAVPMAMLPGEQRQQLLEEVKKSNVYTGELTNAKRTTYNGRSAYVYEIEVQPVGYAQYLKRLGEQLGIQQFAQIDPAQYASAKGESLHLTVDIATKQLLKSEYPNLAQAETYESYGVHITQELPAKPLDAAELQKRIQSALM